MSHVNNIGEDTDKYRVPWATMYESSIWFDEQFRLTAGMMANITNMRTRHNNIVQEMAIANDAISNLASEELHLRRMLEFNANIIESLNEQKLYLDEPSVVPSGHYSSMGFVSQPMSPQPISPLPEDLHFRPGDVMLNIDDIVSPDSFIRPPLVRQHACMNLDNYQMKPIFNENRTQNRSFSMEDPLSIIPLSPNQETDGDIIDIEPPTKRQKRQKRQKR
jgi:hypothetical protein